MNLLRRVENIELAIEGRENKWSGVRGMVHAADAFTIRVVCRNCVNEYDMQFKIGTTFDQYGYGEESHLVTRNGTKHQPVKCRFCRVARLTRKLRQS